MDSNLLRLSPLLSKMFLVSLSSFSFNLHTNPRSTKFRIQYQRPDPNRQNSAALCLLSRVSPSL